MRIATLASCLASPFGANHGTLLWRRMIQWHLVWRTQGVVRTCENQMQRQASRYWLTTRTRHLHPYFVERIRPNPVSYQLRTSIVAPRGLWRHTQWVDDLGRDWTIAWRRKGVITPGVSILCPDAGYEIAIDDSTGWVVGVKTDCRFQIVTPERQIIARLQAGLLSARHTLEVEGRTVAVGIYRRCRCRYPIVVRRTCPFDERICVALYVSMLHWPDLSGSSN